ncbi:hypothetical protein F383_22440 [Gossypium arboreum]|uniref:Uncharacterized protein n=1 Tax=Gossypium arboreum TaxID=29729 RepID=A0A0B0P0D5_GOSAR|nr:hypothetical protein F383_22440 [Gossypium arboreum]
MNHSELDRTLGLSHIYRTIPMSQKWSYM